MTSQCQCGVSTGCSLYGVQYACRFSFSIEQCMRSRTGRILLIGEVSLQYSKSYNTQLQHSDYSVPPIAADTEAGKRGSQMGARLRPWTHTCPKAALSIRPL